MLRIQHVTCSPILLCKFTFQDFAQELCKVAHMANDYFLNEQFKGQIPKANDFCSIKNVMGILSILLFPLILHQKTLSQNFKAIKSKFVSPWKILVHIMPRNSRRFLSPKGSGVKERTINPKNVSAFSIEKYIPNWLF